MDQKVKKYNLNDPAQYEDEISYWLSIDPKEKLSILQDLREDYIRLYNKQELYNESRKGLHRVYRIIKLSES